MAKLPDPVADVAETLPLTSRPPAPAAAESTERAYLLVFEENTAVTYELPRSGEVIIGRAPEVTLQLADPSASRQHARLDVQGGEVFVSDLGSRNGTLINGVRIAAPQTLIAGDVITICKASLIFYRQAPLAAAASIYTVAQIRQRLQEEIDRSLRYQRQLSLLSLRLSHAPSEPTTALRAVAANLRKMDGVAWSGTQQLLVLLPEMGAEETSTSTAEILAALSAVSIEARAGFAVCPTDGSDVDTLLSGAQAAAAAADAQSSPTRQAAETATTLEVAGRRIVLVDSVMVRLYGLIEKLAPSELPVLIQGETGVGKEIAASAIHHLSRRQNKPFVSVNCAALPESLVESELFGHERGAFTGAVSAKPGLLEMANFGTIFLDEIGELPASIQAKLLRVLETQRLMRVGDVRERPIDVRIVAATNRDLQAEVAASRFRKDLFFRLGAARLHLPPLRDRRRELPVLSRALLAEACARLNREPIEISAAAMYRIQAYPWPGNIRELRNVMDFVAATVDGNELSPWHIEEQLAQSEPTEMAPAAAPPPTKFRPLEEEIRELERRRISEALTAAKGVQTHAAELISMPIRTFSSKVKQYQLGHRKPSSQAE